ncbi:MAG: gamma-glutamyltransferase [Myxococcota bacterium]
MSAAIAAGNPHTARAAADILRAGGNAVDAAIAAGLASFVSEPLLSSAGGAGMMLISTAAEDAVVDFFSAFPGQGGVIEASARDFVPLEIDFGSATQVFHVGRASAAPPMALSGLAEASRRFGSLPLRDLIGPACELAQHGAPVSPESAEVFRLLWPINQLSAATMAAYSHNDLPPAPGSRHPMPRMVDVLEAFAEAGGMPEALNAAILEEFGVEQGGCLTRADLVAPIPVVTPRRFSLGDWTVLTSPRIGGELVRVITEALIASTSDSPAIRARQVAEACRLGHRAKTSDSIVGSTTHISVVDDQGTAVSMTLTNGEGCGYLVPGTPIQLNNFLGEEDLNPEGFFRYPPGTPLPSAIAPTIARSADGLLALGSGGANRIRSVVSQVLHRVAIEGERLEPAIYAPRVHAEEESVWLEMADRALPSETLHALHESFRAVYEFPTRAFFFGGVHAVLQRHGETTAVGDPRRGGATFNVDE